jgi:hypothetical protein
MPDYRPGVLFGIPSWSSLQLLAISYQLFSQVFLLGLFADGCRLSAVG